MTTPCQNGDCVKSADFIVGTGVRLCAHHYLLRDGLNGRASA